ncbi:hypothetical protein Emed_004413 [Eimeria media]
MLECTIVRYTYYVAYDDADLLKSGWDVSVIMTVFPRLRKASAALALLVIGAHAILLVFSSPVAAWSLTHTNSPAFLSSPQTGLNPWKGGPPCSSCWGAPPLTTPEGCSDSALRAFGSFFRSRKSAADASPSEPQQKGQQQQQHTSVDLYRLLGVAPDASPAAVALRAKDLQAQLDQLASEGSAATEAAATAAAAAAAAGSEAAATTSGQVDPLLADLVREVAETLQDPQKRAAFDREGLIPPSLAALLSQLPSPAAAAATAAAAPDGQAEGGAEVSVDTPEEEDDDREEGEGNPTDLFSAIFGGPLGSSFGGGPFGGPGAMRLRMQPQQGPDVEAFVRLSFAAAALEGAPSVPVSVTRLEECDACNGTGGAGGAKPKSCKTCGGRGLQTESKRSAYGIVSTASTCAACGGQGHLQAPRCSSCGGHGRQQSNTTLQVAIPPGVADGSTLVVEGAGSAGKNGGPRGNLCVCLSLHPAAVVVVAVVAAAVVAAAVVAAAVVAAAAVAALGNAACLAAAGELLTVRVEEDSRFSRKGSDVFSEVTVSLAEAALGTTRKIETVDGEAELTIPPNSHPGQELRLKGRGARVLEGGPRGPRGDHVVNLRVALPANVSEEERRLLQRLKELQSSSGAAATAAAAAAGSASSRPSRQSPGRQRDSSSKE